MNGTAWFKYGQEKVCWDCRMEKIVKEEAENEKSALDEEELFEGLPDECEKGRWIHCFECLYYAGVLKTDCPKNGGTAKFEPAKGLMGEAKVYEPWTLANCPAYKVPDSDPNKVMCFQGSDGELRWGRNLEGVRVPDLDRIRLNSAREEREYFQKMEIRKVERGEKVMNIDAPLKDRPTRKIYSFIKG